MKFQQIFCCFVWNFIHYAADLMCQFAASVVGRQFSDHFDNDHCLFWGNVGSSFLSPPFCLKSTPTGSDLL